MSVRCRVYVSVGTRALAEVFFYGFIQHIELHHDHFFCRGSDSEVKITIHSFFHCTLFVNVLILQIIRHIFLFSPFLKSTENHFVD